MSEMIERVARAMAAKAYDDWDAPDSGCTLSGNDPDEMREYYRDLARAAIAAMREPGDAVIDAICMASSSAEQPSKYFFDVGVHARAEWQAAIDEILK
tara:strand:+ start:554 stop:847 length:294 start_codon:yes stop_codon:yes gene_type:complete